MKAPTWWISTRRPRTNRYIGVDGLHPTEAGYRRMADEFCARIGQTLEVH